MLISALQTADAGTRNGRSSVAGVRVSKKLWSGSARISIPCTAAYRIAPNRIVRTVSHASGCRKRIAAGKRIAVTAGTAWRTYTTKSASDASGAKVRCVAYQMTYATASSTKNHAAQLLVTTSGR